MKLDDLKARLQLIAAWHKPGGPTPKEGMPNRTKTCLEAAQAITDLEALVGELGEALRPYLAVLAEKPQKANWTDRYCDARDQLESVARATLAKLEKARGKDQTDG